MSGTDTVRVDMTDKLVILRATLEARRSRPDAPLERDANTVAYYVLRAQSGRTRPTIGQLVQYIKENPAGGGERQGDFNDEAWVELTKEVIAALKSDTPSKSLEKVRVSTAPR